MVSTSAWHAASFGVRSPDQACGILGVDWISTLETVSLVRHGSSVVGAPLRNLGKFVYPTLPVSFG